MKEQGSGTKNRYLVLHDYGMGGLWCWVWARSPDEILDAVAEVEVVTDDTIVQRMGSDELDEIDIDALPDSPLADLHEQRLAHRNLPGYGVLANRAQVYLRDASPDYDGVVYLAEFGPDGRRLREVAQRPDGDCLRSDDWPFNPPIDLRDPQYVPMQISAEAFEDAWRRARRDADAP